MEIPTAPVNESLEAIKKLKVEELKKILRDRGQPVTGKKADLVLRCHVLFERLKTPTYGLPEQDNVPLLPVTCTTGKKSADITYESLMAEAVDCVWATDLRGLPPFNFVQLYDYLVIKTAKYDHASIRTSGYKKLKAFQFFKEGHIRRTHISAKGGITYVKGEVLASMKQQKYKVMISMNHLGEVLKAACQCPAGRGVDGLGHCNHVGGILFAVENFCRQGLKEHGEPVSCTSRLCSWNAPRNVQVDPEPVNNIVITKYRFGKKTDQCAKVSLYDPRAPADRRVNPEALSQLSAELSNCLQSSCYFLFHNVSPQPTADENVQIDCICETVPENAPDIVTENDITDLPFSDDYDISSSHFKSMMDYYADTQSVSDVDIEKVERVTRGQSNNEVWRQLKRDKLTASNFHDAAVRRKEPDKFLRNIMYISEKKKGIASLEYGQLHEGDAVASYVAAKAAEGNTLLRVEEVGTILSKERPGYGASLDRKVYDPKASGMKVGGLEAKCPYCKRGMTVEQACKDPNFCLYIDDDGLPKLKFGHKYYYQVQGQMYVCNLE